jgi:hypothetical protein
MALYRLMNFARRPKLSAVGPAEGGICHPVGAAPNLAGWPPRIAYPGGGLAVH